MTSEGDAAFEIRYAFTGGNPISRIEVDGHFGCGAYLADTCEVLVLAGSRSSLEEEPSDSSAADTSSGDNDPELGRCQYECGSGTAPTAEQAEPRANPWEKLLGAGNLVPDGMENTRGVCLGARSPSLRASESKSA